jgi:putative SOS response-associated peptidase YedK
MHWGLISPWAPDEKISNQIINARAETVQEKMSFKGPLAKRRCLILADGFYEWLGEKGAKQPHFIHRKDDHSFAMAGLWGSLEERREAGGKLHDHHHGCK